MDGLMDSLIAYFGQGYIYRPELPDLGTFAQNHKEAFVCVFMETWRVNMTVTNFYI